MGSRMCIVSQPNVHHSQRYAVLWYTAGTLNCGTTVHVYEKANTSENWIPCAKEQSSESKQLLIYILDFAREKNFLSR